MNPKELEAYVALSGTDKLADPRYMHDPRGAEERLKLRVKECWGLREFFPEWVKQYVKRWSGVSSGQSLKAVPK